MTILLAILLLLGALFLGVAAVFPFARKQTMNGAEIFAALVITACAAANVVAAVQVLS